MDLKLYDTLTREKRTFAPLDRTRVRMYVCGPTVYDFAHIGNARPLIVFDVLFRLLRHLYGPEHVQYVRNVTDVDDKINARAAERGIAIRDLTETTYNNFREDVAALGCLPPTVEPRATEHIAEMKILIERLIAAKKARGWTRHKIYSDFSGDYTRDYVSREDADVPAYNVFTRRDGTIRHFWSVEMGPGTADPGQDPRGAPDLDPLWTILDTTPEGRGKDWYPSLSY